MIRLDTWRRFDFWLFAIVLVLSIFGVAMINSAVAGNDSLADLVLRQVIYVGLGLVVIFVAAAVDYHYWMSFTRPMYVAVVFLLIVIFIFEKASFGSARWITTGLVNIQPSELAKIVIILVLAELFAKSHDQPHDVRWIIRSLIPVAIMVIWILLQPNLSMTIVIFVIWFSMIWIRDRKSVV